MAASSSRNFSFLGFSAMSIGVATMLDGSFSLSSPCFCSSSKARPLLEGSFGMAMVAPSLSSAKLLIFFE
ncbi:Uncharacterised protein [Bordetella pertussis]|nr:Uncharacterised protein [Bordetella pertussis]CFO70699.1 Uncharacterised protein [Bordetella pertussis]CFU81119.1 Uncharacterised protein [Bordetella pertussis]CPH99169.1 Uncharacterised protein [Bordetella pertussis]CPL91258.1 Uncharacterised protein [Bordetella pertussis]